MKYQPSNGAEGAEFMNAFCCRCAKDIKNDCDILARSFLPITDPDYPAEWIKDDNDPYDRTAKCTAFHEVGFVLKPKEEK